MPSKSFASTAPDSNFNHFIRSNGLKESKQFRNKPLLNQFVIATDAIASSYRTKPVRSTAVSLLRKEVCFNGKIHMHTLLAVPFIRTPPNNQLKLYSRTLWPSTYHVHAHLVHKFRHHGSVHRDIWTLGHVQALGFNSFWNSVNITWTYKTVGYQVQSRTNGRWLLAGFSRWLRSSLMWAVFFRILHQTSLKAKK